MSEALEPKRHMLKITQKFAPTQASEEPIEPKSVGGIVKKPVLVVSRPVAMKSGSVLGKEISRSKLSQKFSESVASASNKMKMLKSPTLFKAAEYMAPGSHVRDMLKSRAAYKQALGKKMESKTSLADRVLSEKRLTTAERNKLPKSMFGDPVNRKYPITDPKHAAVAKAYANRFASKSLEKKIDAKANKKINENIDAIAQVSALSESLVILRDAIVGSIK